MTVAQPLLVFGNGRLAEQLLAELDGDERYRVVAVAADRDFLSGDELRGLPQIELEAAIERFPPTSCQMLVAIGYRRMRDRRVLHARARGLGYELPAYVARHALVHPSVELGPGAMVLPTAYLGPDVRLGAGAHVRPQCYVGHDGVVGDHAFLAPGVLTGGDCRIGEASFLGLGARVVNGVTIGAECLVGAGALVLADTEPCGVYLGAPAKRAREHPETGVVIEG